MTFNNLKKITFIFICLFVFGCFNVSNAEEANDTSSSSTETTNNTSNNSNCYKTDTSKKGDDNLSKVATVLGYIPIPDLRSLFIYFAFYGEIFVGTMVNLTDGGGFLSAVLDLGNYLIASPEKNIIFQRAFSTNQYCQYQDIFKEEDTFLNADNRRYSVFPMLPLEIGVNNKGQCDVDGVLDGNFKLLIMQGGGLANLVSTTAGDPLHTKCSYSYTNYNSTCMLENTLPLVVVGEAAQLAADLTCGIVAAKADKVKDVKEVKDKISKVKKFLEKTKKVRKNVKEAVDITATIGSYAFELIALPVFEYDAYSIKNFYGASIGLTALVGMIKSLSDHNYVCAIASGAMLVAVERGMPIMADIIFRLKYNQAKDAITDLKFCGYDWYSYAGVKQGQADFLEDDFSDAEYFERGPFKKSYSYAVSSCIDKPDNCKQSLESFGIEIDDDNKIKVDDIDKSKQATITSRSLSNRIYREYLYNGKEYRFDYKKDGVYDPRLPEYKGYYDVAHRYYMRGNEKANYACERFEYNGFGCVLREEDVQEADRKNEKLAKFSLKKGSTNANDDFYDKYKHSSNTGETFYVIKGSEFLAKYNQICKDKFNQAYESCIERSRKHACVESVSGKTNKFCKATYETDQAGRTSLLSTMVSGSDDIEGYCNIDKTYGTKVEPELLVVKQYGNQYICVFSNNFCPYDFKLNAGLNYKASYCEADYTNQYVEDGEDVYDISNYKYKVASNLDENVCKKGIFTQNTCSMINETAVNKSHKQYAFDKLKENVGNELYVNDFQKMYKTDSQGNIVNTAAYGRIKNFCQYKAHCVKVEKEDLVDANYDKVAAFMDMSCNGQNTNSRNYLNMGLEPSSTRQLTSTVVECVYESLKNLVNGVAGYSSCKGAYKLNSDGYCGDDTRQVVEYRKSVGDDAFFEAKYNFVKGYELPVEMNPFIMVQNNLRKLIIIAMTLALVLWGYRTIFMNYKKFKDYANKAFIRAIMPTVLKMALIVWLALSSGWRDGLADKLFAFTSDAYEFANRIFIDTIANEHSQILKGSTKLGIERTINTLSESNISLISFDRKYNILEELVLSEGVESFGVDANKFILVSKNQEISELTYFISKLNKKYPGNTYKLALVGDSTNNTCSDGFQKSNNSSLCYSVSTNSIKSIWNSKYDGCYFDTSEYEDSKTYLAMFDAIDCRIARYLGFAPGLNIANIILIPLLLTFFSTVGAFVLSMALTFVFTIFNLMIEVVFTFLVSFFTLSLMVFLSPIILPLALFEKTKKVFDKWITKILSCIFQPIMVAITVTIFVNVLDAIMLKSATFENHNIEGRYPTMKCGDTIGLFCIINKPGLAFVVAGDTLAQGLNFIKSVLRGNFDINAYPAMTILVDLLLIFILFKLGNDLLSYAKTISEALFGKSSGLDGRGDTGKMFNNAQNSATALSKDISGRISSGTKNIFSRPFAKLGRGINAMSDKFESSRQNTMMYARARLGDLRSRESSAETDKEIGRLEQKIQKMEKGKDFRAYLAKAGRVMDKGLVWPDHITKNSFKDYAKKTVFQKHMTKIPDKVAFGGKRLLNRWNLYTGNKEFLDKVYSARQNKIEKEIKKMKKENREKWDELSQKPEFEGKDDTFIARTLLELGSFDAKYNSLRRDMEVLDIRKSLDEEKLAKKERDKTISTSQYVKPKWDLLGKYSLVYGAIYGKKNAIEQARRWKELAETYNTNLEELRQGKMFNNPVNLLEGSEDDEDYVRYFKTRSKVDGTPKRRYEDRQLLRRLNKFYRAHHSRLLYRKEYKDLGKGEAKETSEADETNE